MWEESQGSAIIFNVQRLSIWQTVAFEEKLLDDPRKTLLWKGLGDSTTYTRPNTEQPQCTEHNNECNTSLILYHFRAVKRDPGELRYGVCMEIVFLSSFNTCFLDNNPNCYGIPQGNEAKYSDTFSNFHFIVSALYSSDTNFTCFYMPWTIILLCYNNILFSRSRKGWPFYLCLLFCYCSGVTLWPEGKK